MSLPITQQSKLPDTISPEKRAIFANARGIWVMALVFVVALFFHADLAPLEETHWDAPIYVQISKRAAETHMLDGYRQHAREIEPGPENAHWNFTRIGHILILGQVKQLFDSPEAALVAMQWLYRLFMALGVALSMAIGSRLVHLYRGESPDSIWWGGYAIAAVTYVASDSYRGLQGHFVSEPPAFAALALFALALLWAVERRSLKTAVLAAGMLFVLFVIRLDAIVQGVVFLIVLAAALAVNRRFDAWQVLSVTGLVFLASYMAYAWWFSPLVNPTTLMAFKAEAKGLWQGLPFQSLWQIVIAGGLLWIGAAFSWLNRRHDPVVRFASVWLGLALLPLFIDAFSGGALQVRMAFFVGLPLLVLAGEGWAWILRCLITQGNFRPLIVSVALLALLAFIPEEPTRRMVREAAVNHLPLELKEHLFRSLSNTGEVAQLLPDPDPKLGLLVRPVTQRWTYHYLQARELSHFLYRSGQKSYLIWPSEKLPGQGGLQDHVGLIVYFRKPYPQDADLVLSTRPNKKTEEPCISRVPTELEPLVFCTTLTMSEKEQLLRQQIPLYVLGVDGYSMPELPPSNLRLRVSAPPFTLYEVVED